MATPKQAEAGDLQAHICLSKLCDCLQQHGQLTITALKNWHGFSDPTLAAAIKLGAANKNIKKEAYNYITLIKTYVVPESEYYDSITGAVGQLWAQENYSPDQFYIEETAKKDSKIIGPWTRPDLLLVSHKKFPWTIGVEFDVVTFEVKRPDSSNVLAVFEALSHSSVATKAYVVFPLNEKEWTKIAPAQAQRVKDECARHGVGLILVDDVSGVANPVHLIKAIRREISHERCSNFLEAVVSPEGRSKIAAWK
jgi:hypothetical protein